MFNEGGGSIVNIVTWLDVQAIMVQLLAQVRDSPLLQGTQANSAAYPQPQSMGKGEKVKWPRHEADPHVLLELRTGGAICAFMVCKGTWTFTHLSEEWNVCKKINAVVTWCHSCLW
jgi:hypothetical protein